MNSCEQEQAIREAAYHKWEQAGRPHGDGMEFWLESEQEILGRSSDDSETQHGTSGEVQDLGPEPMEPVLVASGLSSLKLHTDDGRPAEEFHQDARTSRRSRRRAT